MWGQDHNVEGQHREVLTGREKGVAFLEEGAVGAKSRWRQHWGC